MKRITILVSLILVCLYFPTVSVAENVELDEAISHFNNGKFQMAVDLLERLLVTKTLAKKDYLQANEYLAVAYLSQHKTNKVRAIFTGILKQTPDYRPDDRWWPHQRFMSEYFKTLQEVGKNINISSTGPGIKTIAIMDFENNSIENADKYDNLGNALAKIIINDFSVLSNLKIVERERIQFILDELELTGKKVGEKNVIDPSSAPRLGKLLGAHTFVFGSFIQIGKIFRIDARIVKTETSEILKTFSVEGKPNKLFELAKKLTLKIAKDLDVEINRSDGKQLDLLGRQDIPIEAVALFGDAMSKANQEDYQAALVSLEEALKRAPGFEKAQEMVDVLKPLAISKG